MAAADYAAARMMQKGADRVVRKVVNTALDTLRNSVSRDGRIHYDGNSLKQLVKGIGYDKDALLDAKAIFEKSIAVRKAEKYDFVVLNAGHRRRIALEESALEMLYGRIKGGCSNFCVSGYRIIYASTRPVKWIDN